MKIRRKFSSCPNCGQLLERKDNFCPKCGQENDDKNVSANILFTEFIGTYFSLDSSFFRSIKPFLFQPGFLTNQFNKGKRKSYANPVRLYLILSLFYFFVVSVFGLWVVNNGDEKREKTGLVEVEEKNDSEVGSDGAVFFDAKEYSDKWQSDTIQYSTNEDKDSTNFIVNRINWKLVEDLKYKDEFSDQEVLDSMKLGKLSYFDNYLARQVIRINRANTESVLGYLFQNLPLMMLAAIPLFAFMLKLVYMRSKTLYVKHIIHALHLHSFAYFIYGLGLLVIMYIFEGNLLQALVWSIGYGSVFMYGLISFKKVYQQGWVKTFVKFIMVGFGYSFLILLFFIIEAAASVLFY